MDLYFITMPVHIFSSHLNADEKIVLSLLTSLSTKEGYCFATNEYIANSLKKTEESIKQIIKKLKANELISIEEVSRKNRDRKIYISDLKKLHEFNRKKYAKFVASSEQENEPKVEEPTIEEDRYDKFAPKKAKKATTITINNISQFTLTPRMSEFAKKQGFNEAETATMFEHFLSHHASKGSTFKDWDMAFNTWVHNAKNYQSQKKFSNAGARGNNTMNAAQRITIENLLLEDHERFDALLVSQGIFMNRVMWGEVALPFEFRNLYIATISTLKHGTKKIWVDSERWNPIDTGDIITLEAIEHKDGR